MKASISVALVCALSVIGCIKILAPTNTVQSSSVSMLRLATSVPITTDPTSTTSQQDYGPVVSLVYWAPMLYRGSMTNSNMWWREGLKQLALSLTSAVASETNHTLVHFLVISDVDTAVLHRILTTFVHKVCVTSFGLSLFLMPYCHIGIKNKAPV